MGESSNNLKRILAWIVITAAVTGIILFGYRLLSNSVQVNLKKENPWEFELDSFQKIDPDLVWYEETGLIELNIQNPTGLACGPDGDIYVTGDEKLVIIKDGGKERVRVHLEETAKCVSVDKDNGDIYLGMLDHVEVYDNKGKRKDLWPELGELSIITSIAVTQNHAFVADAGNHVVLKFDKSGKLLGRIGDKDETHGIPGFIIPSPYFDVAEGTGDSIWVTNSGRHLIENYTFDGDRLFSWGRPSMNIDGFSGCCNPAHFAMLPDRSFVTSEKGLVRVKVYDPSGDFVCAVAGSGQFSGRTIAPDLAVDSKLNILALDDGAGVIRIFSRIKKHVE